MTTKPARPVAVSLIWTVIGACALVVVTVAITVSVASLHTAARTSELLTQLHRANGQIDDLRTTYAAQQQQSVVERDQLQQQNRITRAQLRALLTYLREHGIDVPPAVVKPLTDAGPRSRPKGPGPRGPNPSTSPSPSSTPAPSSPSSHPRPSRSPSPRPTSGTTAGPTTAPDPAVTDLLCMFAPLLCLLIWR